MTNVKSQQPLQFQRHVPFSTNLIDLSRPNELKGAYPSTGFRKSSTLRIRRTTGRISKIVSIYLKKLYCHIYKRKRLSLDVRKNNFHLSLWTHLRAKTTKRLNLYAFCKLVIIPHNLANKFQPLDLAITQKATKFVSNQFSKWYAERVSHQLTNGKSPGDVKFYDLKPLDAKWVVEMYEYLKEQKDSVIKEFEKAEIKEVVKSAQDIDTRCENSP